MTWTMFVCECGKAATVGMPCRRHRSPAMVEVALAAHIKDEDLIRGAIADPGQFVKREHIPDTSEPVLETIENWGARAVVAALSRTSPWGKRDG